MSVLKVPISSFCRTSSGGTPLRDKGDLYYGGNIPWVKSGELRETLVTHTEEHITQQALAESAAKIVPAGAVLVAMYGATVGRVGLLGIDAATNQAICSIVPDPTKANARYLFHYLQAEMPQFLSKRNGGAQPNISQEIIRNTKIALPSLEEQRRIAAILDQAEVLRAKRRQALAKLDTLTQSLFLEMFGDPRVEKSHWPKVKFGSIAESKLGKMLDKGKHTGQFEMFRYLRNANVQWNRIDIESLLEMEFSHADRRKFELIPGDLLMCEGGEPGRCAVWNGEIAECFYQKALHRCRIDPRRGVAKFFVFLFWELARREALFFSTSTISHLTAEKLDEMLVILPPLELQKKFEKLVATTESSARAALTHSEYLDKVTHSLQHRAFRGEL